LRLFGIKNDRPKEEVTREEIQFMVETGGESGTIAEEEQEIIENVFAFDELTAQDVCTHRMELKALPQTSDLTTVLNLFHDELYSRIPIYAGDLDHIVGVLHAKDVLKFLAETDDRSAFSIETIMHEPHYVPFSKKTGDLFREMREMRAWVTIVIDEYGGTMGIITMDDLVASILGHMQDEYDLDEEIEIEVLSESTWRVQGRASLGTVAEFFSMELPLEEYDTLSGFLIGELGQIPGADDRPELSLGDYIFYVEDIEEKRISRVFIRRNDTKEKDDHHDGR